MAKLNMKIADQIRKEYLDNENKTTQNQLAKKYQVRQNVIWKILNNINYRKEGGIYGN